MSSNKKITETILLVIDTDQYSGNFERELCAHVTGHTGDCEVGDDLAEEAKEVLEHKIWWDENIKQVEDEEHSEFYRPCAIYETPEYFNDGYGGHFRRDCSQEEKDKIKNRVIQATITRDQSTIDQLNRRLKEKDFTHGWTEDSCKDFLKRYSDNHENLKQSPLRMHPAYQSVVIYLEQVPPTEVLEEAKSRAYDFFENHCDYAKTTITGFRILKKTVEESISEETIQIS